MLFQVFFRSVFFTFSGTFSRRFRAPFFYRFLNVFLPFSMRFFRVFQLLCTVSLPAQKRFFTVFRTFFYRFLYVFLQLSAPFFMSFRVWAKAEWKTRKKTPRSFFFNIYIYIYIYQSIPYSSWKLRGHRFLQVAVRTPAWGLGGVWRRPLDPPCTVYAHARLLNGTDIKRERKSKRKRYVCSSRCPVPAPKWEAPGERTFGFGFRICGVSLANHYENWVETTFLSWGRR